MFNTCNIISVTQGNPFILNISSKLQFYERIYVSSVLKCFRVTLILFGFSFPGTRS
jgi:hypothetical protein